MLLNLLLTKKKANTPKVEAFFSHCFNTVRYFKGKIKILPASRGLRSQTLVSGCRSHAGLINFYRNHAKCARDPFWHCS